MTNLPTNKEYIKQTNEAINTELTELKKILIAKKGGATTLQILKKLNDLAEDENKLSMVLKYL